MSCFLVQHESIGLIAAYAIKANILQYGICYPRRHLLTTVDQVSCILAQANLDSVAHRYGDDQDVDSVADYINGCIRAAKTEPSASIGEMAKTLSCYEYQACEPDDFYDSLAYKILTVCRVELLRNLPEYDKAAGWE